MDLKGWKKVAGDKHSATLVHPKGHTMTIALRALPKILQQQIGRLELAHGGDVLASGEGGKSEQGHDVRLSKSLREHGDKSSAKVHDKFAKEEARGRHAVEKTVRPNIKGLADGGSVRQNSLDPDPQKARDAMQGAQQGESVSKGWQNLKNEFGMGDKQDQQPRRNYAGDGEPADSVVEPVQPPAAQAPVAQAAPPAPLPSQAAPLPNLVSPDQTLNAPAAVQLQQKAVGQQADIDAQKARALEENTQENVDRQQAIAQAQANSYRELKDHADDFAKYINNNPINPRAYQENMNSGQKVSTAIGLFLGGFGTPFGGHNYAMDFLNKQIDRDIAAQQQRSENQKTVWGAYEQLYHDSTIATNLAKVSANDILVQKTNLAAAKLGSPEAIKAANAMAAQKAIENNQLLLDSAGRLGTMKTGGAGASHPSQPQGAGLMPPSPSGKPAAAVEKKGDWYEDHVLSPESDKIALGLQYNPLAKPNLAAIQEQKARADLADKAIAAINNHFDPIAGTTGEATYSREHLEPFLANVPLVGGALANASHTMTDTPEARDYDMHRSAIVGAVRGALQGNVSDDLLDKTVVANLPQKGDTPKRLKEKRKTLKEFIKSHTRTDLLRPFKMTKE